MERTPVGTTHALAECLDCGRTWDDYITAIEKARRHAKETGHTVRAERAQTWTYNPR